MDNNCIKNLRFTVKCFWCCKDIIAGSKAYCDEWFYDGEYVSEKFHEKCFVKYLEKNPKE